MQLVTHILFIATLVVVIVFFVVLIVTRIMKTLAKCKKLVQFTLTKVLRQKCENKPNKTIVLNDKEGNVLTVQFMPKKVK